MNRVLILFAHPALNRSKVNRHLIEAVRDVAGVTIHDLYETYPDSFIDVDWEQTLLREHEVVVWHHPFYWYSCPALLKEWIDLTLEYGFAYGEGGTALHGKRVMTAITTGGPSDSYHPQGYNRFTIAQLLAPFAQTAHLCGMEYLEPFIVHGSLRISPEEVAPHAAAYRLTIERLRDGRATS